MEFKLFPENKVTVTFNCTYLKNNPPPQKKE